MKEPAPSLSQTAVLRYYTKMKEGIGGELTTSETYKEKVYGPYSEAVVKKGEAAIPRPVPEAWHTLSSLFLTTALEVRVIIPILQKKKQAQRQVTCSN